MEATASAKYLRGSAQKARLVVDLIRGKDVNQALAILRFTKKRAAASIEKCMRSAPQGRAYREQRHFCHVTISLSNDARPEPKGSKSTAVEEAKPTKLAAS